jgi:WD40 repeat protein
VQKLAYQDVDQPKLAAAFSPDGQILAIALPGEGVQLLDTATGKTISSVRESDFPVFTNLDVASRLAFSPDGRRLFFSARGNGIREWDVTRLTGSGATG